MQILLLVIAAYLFLPVIGELFLLLTDGQVVAGNVTWELFSSHLIFSSIVYGLIISSYIKFKKNNLGFKKNIQDRRTLFRISCLITFFCICMFYFSGYDYLVKGVNRGEIRVGMGVFGFLSKWIVIYAIPLLLFLTTIIALNNKISKIYYYIYAVGIVSAIFTGYKFVLIFCFIPVLILILFNKNIVKTVGIIVPIILIVLTLTTKLVMGYDSYQDSFNFILHRMTVMSAFGTIGVWDNYPNGADFSDILKLSYSIFGSKINEFVFGIDFNSMDILDTNLSRKITYLVYPSWENALSGTSNVTVTSFGEAVYMFGKFYWIYAIFSGMLISFFISKIIKYFYNGNAIKSSLYLIYTISALLSWMNSSSVFTLISFPIFIYMLMSYFMLIFLLKTKIL